MPRMSSTPPLGAAHRYDPHAAARELAATDPRMAHLIDVVGAPTYAADTADSAHGFTDVYASLAR
jgi:hypothetical protein